jgi:predicted PurR-regulated permease PerM
LAITAIIYCLYFIFTATHFGVPNAFIIGFMCCLNIIPYIGSLIASVLAAVLTMLSNLGSDFQTEILPTTIYVLIGFGLFKLLI